LCTGLAPSGRRGMNAGLALSLATWDHDRVMAIHEGHVTVPGVSFDAHILATGTLFPLAVQEARFDITELSLSSHILQVAGAPRTMSPSPPSSVAPFGTTGFTAAPTAASRPRQIFPAAQCGCPSTR